MTVQNPLEVARVVMSRLGTTEQGLLVSHTIAALQWINSTKGNPRRIDDLPGGFSPKLWAHNNRLFTAETVSRNTFRFYVTPEGVNFLKECGVTVDVATDVRPFTLQHSKEPPEVKRMFVQNRTGTIKEVNLATVPDCVFESLREGMLAVHDGRMYGTSPEHILGTD
ncbi:MAG: hypothetical protein A3D44_00850 [Candidatus Staskawiczbacteria bacterium RIFCSPHIGHO2_02_FULL_42_22]|uniref:Uncharacterized protein n=1 Tax=Candidatus Staskawiczbacteria bacterium RIFCSPHIGHO2_02_FULL_42_22 TaxID=1802207 RepID=A0A1G2I418_9BACT|nr:MAG: hypothetical protein A3D44_00850 [Candidatus Staskawiczbacteria bacterium RIFCSPHIGHO2_02_FULL_42_22]